MQVADPHVPPPAAVTAPDALLARARTLGTGTALQPMTQPLRAWDLQVGPWLWLLQGQATAGAIAQTGPRALPGWAGENAQLLTASRAIGPGFLDLRLGTSLEPLTTPMGGTPQLLQFGPPPGDRQPARPLLQEVSTRWSWHQAFLYAAPIGEPALGASGWRASTADLAWAPLGSALQDAPLANAGVVTAGWRALTWQAEGSAIGLGGDWAGRLTFLPGPSWVGQVSHGQLGPKARTTWSLTRIVERTWGLWSSTLLWGRLAEAASVEQSYGGEIQLDLEIGHLVGRFELLDRYGGRSGALTLGGVRDLDQDPRYDLGLGADATIYSLDSAHRALYGDPIQARIYLRLRPQTRAEYPDAPIPPLGR